MSPSPPTFADLIGPALASALEKRGFTELTPVQLAMLDPELAGRDLRVSSQTGSGKTVAIGLAIRTLVEAPAPSEKGMAHPRVLVVVPTRELAKQVNEELTWLYAPLQARVASATGGENVRDERRAFAGGPVVIVGTPGRLLDHLTRGSIDASGVEAVVLDEADRMLDLGFREELEAILGHAPPEHATHLVSATFPRDVLALANRVQKDPAQIQGTPLGTANADIDHVIHLVAPHDRIAAIVNLLLSTPGAQTLVFARTRADVAQITGELGEAGFEVRALSGEMEQNERNRALAAFKRGSLNALVATDVAARGIDVQDIARVVHAEAPTDPDSYTHRAGRTGRAGRKGTSAVMVSPAGLARVAQLLRRAGVRYRMAPVPTAADIRRAGDERLLAELTAAASENEEESPRLEAIAERLVEAGDVVKTIARLLARAHVAAGPEPRDVRVLEAPTMDRERPMRPRLRDGDGPIRSRGDGPERTHAPRAPREHREPAAPSDRREPREPRDAGGWVPFRFTWGKEHGADPRRLLAMACRRGGIQAGDIGAIVVGRTHSVVNVSSAAAEGFARAASEHDPRDPRVSIRPEGDATPGAPRGGEGSFAPPRHDAPDARPRRDDGPPRKPRDTGPREAGPRHRPPVPRGHAPRPSAATSHSPRGGETRPKRRP